ncbi:MAG: hypothetical protein CUN57_01585, partial [Phototrophicales bacterium]
SKINPPRHSRPKNVSQCPKGRCPYVGCRYHIWMDVNPKNGSITYNFPPEIGPTDILQPCALRFAEQGGRNLEEIGSYFGLTKERIRQIEEQALLRLRDILLTYFSGLTESDIISAIEEMSDQTPFLDLASVARKAV